MKIKLILTHIRASEGRKCEKTKTNKIEKNKSGPQFAYLEKRARASANLIRQPPENSLVGRCCISEEKPRPFKIMLALAGALSASMF